MLALNYFELFGLPPRFGIDLQGLDQTYRRLQAEAHPDRHATGNSQERLQALQWSTTINDGYRLLRHPASRAQCLLDLAGREGEQAVSTTFLIAQMEWREAIDEARQNVAALEALSRRLRQRMDMHEQRLAEALDERGDYASAAERVNELRFYEKLRVEINDALDALTGA